MAYRMRWRLILLYIVLAVIVYAVIYYVVFGSPPTSAGSGGGGYGGDPFGGLGSGGKILPQKTKWFGGCPAGNGRVAPPKVGGRAGPETPARPPPPPAAL